MEFYTGKRILVTGGTGLEWTPTIENAFSVFERMVLSVMLGHLHSCQELVGCHVSKRRVDPSLVVVYVCFLDGFGGLLEALKVSRPDVFALQCLMEGFHVSVLFRCVDGYEFLLDVGSSCSP